MDAKKLLKLLKDHKVSFVIIGGLACIAHGYSRLTQDIDIFVEPIRANIEKVFEALTAYGYDLMDTTVDEALQKKLLFRDYILKTDIHPFVAGVDFATVWKNKIRQVFQGEEIYFCSIDDLIKMKKAAGRPQDLEDLRYLEEIKRQLKQK